MLAIENIEFEDEADMGFKLNSVIKTRKKAEKIFTELFKIDHEEEVVAIISLDSIDRVKGLAILIRGGEALKKVGTDDLFYKALALEADSIIFGYNKAGKIYTDSYDYQFNEFLLKQAEEFRIEVRYNLVLLDSNKWINIY
jgi:DNA repair protein RadC